MKSIITIGLLFLSSFVLSTQSVYPDQKWSRRNPLPSGVALNGAFFHDSFHAWFVGGMGNVVFTSDGGQTWDERILLPRGWLQRVHFTDSQHGVIVGGDDGAENGAIFVTTDGGETWLDRYNVTPRYAFFDICFRGRDTGWISGFQGIFKTTDGGMNWARSSSPGLGWNTSVFFIDDSLGWTTNPTGRILRSTDAGVTWQQQASLGFRWFRRIRFATPQIGWAVGGGLYETKGLIFKTTDGGFTWTLQDSLGGRTHTDIYVRDTLNAWVVGSGGTVLYTTNGGNIWFWDGTNNSDNYNQITFVDDKPWIVGGTNSSATIFTSGPPGFRWKLKSSFVTLEGMLSVAFEDDLHGWIGGRNGVLLRTTDTGEHWSQLPLFAIDLTALAAPASGVLYIGGNTGRFMKTTNGGNSWTINQLPGFYTVSQMQFLSPMVGWVMDDYGPFLKTTNGGQSWQSMTAPGSRFFFIDENNGWVIRPIITDTRLDPWTHLLHTTDGGVTWRDSIFDVGITDIMFTSPEKGWFVATNSIYGTTNGGRTWAHFYSFFEPLRRVRFTSEAEGWALGDQAIYSTTDGGATFAVSRNLNMYQAGELYFFSRLLGFGVGENGSILRYLNSFTGVDPDNFWTLNVPSAFVLEQNYPNPFNPETKIKFQVSGFKFVTLKVYDLLGREVATLVNEEVEPGHYERVFDASGLASGMYFYRLTTGRFTAIKKMLLIR